MEIDKTSWGPGEWQAEPDRKEWRDPATGLPCLAHRNDSMGFWCGYVAVPPGHPLHGKDSFDMGDLDVHGGITYGAACHGHICHIPAPGEPDDVWWLGFDCGHAWDTAPGMRALRIEIGMPEKLLAASERLAERQSYKTLAFVEQECAKLAQQIKAAADA